MVVLAAIGLFAYQPRFLKWILPLFLLDMLFLLYGTISYVHDRLHKNLSYLHTEVLWQSINVSLLFLLLMLSLVFLFSLSNSLLCWISTSKSKLPRSSWTEIFPICTLCSYHLSHYSIPSLTKLIWKSLTLE